MRTIVLFCALILLAAPVAASLPSWIEAPPGTLYLTGDEATSETPEARTGCVDVSYLMDDEAPDDDSAPSATSSLVSSCRTEFLWADHDGFSISEAPTLHLVLSCSAPAIAIGVADLDLAAMTIRLRAGDTTVSTAVFGVVVCLDGQLTMSHTLPAAGMQVPDDVPLRLSIEANWLSLGDAAPTVSVEVGPSGSRLSGFGLPVTTYYPPAARIVQVDEKGDAVTTPAKPGDELHFSIDAFASDAASWRITTTADPSFSDDGGITDIPSSVKFTADLSGFHRLVIEFLDDAGNVLARIAAPFLVLQPGVEDLSEPVPLDDTDAGPGGISDGIPDDLDNCPTVYNPAQSDFDGDGIGDACDVDIDGDNVEDHQFMVGTTTFGRVLDNCLFLPNDQSDIDANGVGDACDLDQDGDGVPDKVLEGGRLIVLSLGQGGDNCPSVVNPDQADLDADLVGDPCDADADGDGTPDDIDVCPGTPNLDQSDLDDDGRGDVCDDDLDGDKMPNVLDNCPRHYNPQQRDLDGDGVGDECDSDVNGDGRVDNLDAGVDQGPPAQQESLFGLADDRQAPGVGFAALLLVLAGLVLVRRRD